MKRNIVIALVATLTFSLVVAGAAFAQGYGPGTGLNLEANLSTYMPTAMADVLGLSVDEVNTRLASSETFTTIALSLGYTNDQLPALMASIRAEAIDLATADGVMTSDQAAFLLNSQYGGNARGNGAGAANSYSAGNGTGLCDGTCIPQTLSTLTGGSMRRQGSRH